MDRNLEIPRLIRSSLLLASFAVLFAVPIHSQNHADDPKPAEPGAQVSPVNPGSNQRSAADQKPRTTVPVTPGEIRQAKIEADTKKLYELSAELRAEVAKTYKESLSLTVLRKAEEIEKLARSLKVLMNQEAATRR